MAEDNSTDSNSDEEVDDSEALAISNIGTHDGTRPDDRAQFELDRWQGGDKTYPFKIRKTAFQVIRVGIWIGFGAYSLILLIYLWHILLPSTWRWLHAEEQHSLADLLAIGTTGAVGAFLGKYFRKIFSDVEEDRK